MSRERIQTPESSYLELKQYILISFNHRDLVNLFSVYELDTRSRD